MTSFKMPDVYLCGRAGSGKDSQAAMLIEKYGYKRIALADPVKDISAKILNISREELEANKKLYRPFLIGIGQGARQYRNWWWANLRGMHPMFRAALLANYLRKYGRPIEIQFRDLDELLDGWGRPDVWLNRFRKELVKAKAEDPNRPIVVTDCRMPNEAKFFKKLNFTGVRLAVSDDVVKQRLFQRDGTTDFSFFTNETERFANKLPVDYVVNGELGAEEVHSAIVYRLRRAI